MPCTNMVFSKDSNSLITVKSDGQCSVFDLEAETFEHKENFSIDEHHKDQIHLITVSNCSKFLVLASLCNNITVWSLKKKKWTFSKALPKSASLPTSLAIRKDQPVLVVSFSDNKILEFNLEGNFIQFSTILPAKTSAVDSGVTGICLDPRNPNAIIFNRNNSIQVLQKEVEEKANSKKAKTAVKSDQQHSVKTVKEFNTVSLHFQFSLNSILIPNPQHLIHLEFLGDNELLSLEINPVTLIENLPMPLRRKTFGKT
jgi:U3 small nucleolar RNA-associated protein 4